MSRSTRTGAAVGVTLALAVGLVPALGTAAYAHPDAKHGLSTGHLPGKQQNVRLVGEAKVAARPGTLSLPNASKNPVEGKVADVNVFGNYAYLAAFREPTCENGGVFVVDVTNPAKPVEVPEAFIPTTPGSFVGEGVQVIEVGARDVLLFNNEICDTTNAAARGGITLVDVTNPRTPVVLAANVGDTTGATGATTAVHTVHSMFGWNDDGRSYVTLVDNDEARDIDIMDITDPAAPVLISETTLVNDARARQANPPNGDSQFHHDLVVKEINGTQTMLASYWDNGYAVLNVEDPASPVFLRDTDFAATEPFAPELNLPEGFEPEGNAHQAEFSPDSSVFIGTDEDFNPFRVVAKVTSGVNAGREFTASQGSGEPNIDEDRSLTGATVYGGFGCDPATIPQGSATQTVLIERGAPAGQAACTFVAKYDNAAAKGYGAVITFNNQRSDCAALVNPLVNERDEVPFIFVNRADGLAILNQTVGSDPCTQASPAIGTTGGNIDIRAVFDGWGYTHLYDARTMTSLGEYALPESLDASKASGFGDLSVHEVAMDPKVPGRAYLSHYAGGFRVVEYDRSGLREIGAYIDPAGSNLWGVEHWTSPTTGQDYVLASDRDYGLQVFQYDATAPTVTAAISPDPIPASATTATVAGTVNEAATVTVALKGAGDDSAPTRSVVLPDGGSYSLVFDVTGFDAGTVTATATAVDTAGNRTTVTDTATRAGGQPAVPPGCEVAAKVRTAASTIVAGQSTGVTVTAPAGKQVDLFAYVRPSTTYKVIRSGVTGSGGTVAFAPLRPTGNTRLYAQIRGCAADKARDSVVLGVRSALTLDPAVRNGTRTYTFTGKAFPARSVVVSLFRSTPDGGQVLVARTQASSTGAWKIRKTFSGTGTFGFTVRTAKDLQNEAGASAVRRTRIS